MKFGLKIPTYYYQWLWIYGGNGMGERIKISWDDEELIWDSYYFYYVSSPIVAARLLMMLDSNSTQNLVWKKKDLLPTPNGF